MLLLSLSLSSRRRFSFLLSIPLDFALFRFLLAFQRLSTIDLYLSMNITARSIG